MGFFLACGVLACVAIYQLVELRRLHTEVQGRTMGALAIQAEFEGEMREAWGCYLKALGGVNHPHLGYYEFDGGIRVMAGRNWCQFNFTDTVDPHDRKQLMNMIAPKIASGSGFILPRIEEEWQSLSKSGAGEQRYIDDGQSGYPKSVYLRCQSDDNCISIRSK